MTNTDYYLLLLSGVSLVSAGILFVVSSLLFWLTGLPLTVESWHETLAVWSIPIGMFLFGFIALSIVGIRKLMRR